MYPSVEMRATVVTAGVIPLSVASPGSKPEEMKRRCSNDPWGTTSLLSGFERHTCQHVPHSRNLCCQAELTRHTHQPLPLLWQAI